MNQRHISCATRPYAASLALEESATGLRQSTPAVWKKYVTTSQEALTGFSGVALAAPHARTKKPTESPNKPTANFIGMLGFRLRFESHTQSQPKTGASVTMKNGLMF